MERYTSIPSVVYTYSFFVLLRCLESADFPLKSTAFAVNIDFADGGAGSRFNAKAALVKRGLQQRLGNNNYGETCWLCLWFQMIYIGPSLV